MIVNKIAVYVITVFVGCSMHAVAAADEKKTASELAITEPLEIWGHIGNKNSPFPSTEYLEKTALDFDKINNPLCAAAAAGNKKELSYLLRDGVSPDSTDSLGISALSHAILGNNKESFSILMSAGASSNQKGPFGVTPLMLAANSNLREMVSLLLLNGADRSIKNDDGETALSIAQRRNLHDVIVLLAPAKKAVPLPLPKPLSPAQSPEETPATPFKQQSHEAEVTENRNLSKISQDRTAAVQKPVPTLAPLDLKLLQTIKQGLTATGSQLVLEGANPNIRNTDGLSPLVIAVSRNDLASAEMLLQNQANIDIRSEFDMTPLMIAVQRGNEQMIRMLRRHGANIQLENIAGQSACDLGLASTDPSIQTLFQDCLQ